MRPRAPRSRRRANTSSRVATTRASGTPSRRQRAATWKSAGESSSGAPRSRTKASSTARKYSPSAALSSLPPLPPPSAVAVMDELETDQRQHGLDAGDALRAGGDQLGETTGGHHRLEPRHLLGQPLEDAVDETDVPVVEPRLHGAGG